MAHLILVNPAGRERLYQELGNELMAIEPPLWCRLIAGYCRDRKHEVEIIDAEAEGLGPFEVARIIKNKDPDLVGMIVYGHQPNASTQQMEPAGETCSAIKAMCDVPIIIAGGHVSVLPERTMREEDVNYVAIGEGAVTIEQLLSETNIHDIPGLVWYDADECCVVRNMPAKNLDVNELYGRTFDLLPMDKYRAHNWHCDDGRPRQPYASIYTSLGCPFKCLSGDTPVNTIYGNIPIKELAEKYGDNGVPVYTYDPETMDAFISDSINIRKYGTEKLVRVHFDDGTHIDCTPDHKFLQFKVGANQPMEQWECEARDLKEKSRVRALRMETTKQGYIDVLWARRSRRKQHRMVMDYVKGYKLERTEQVHHLDHDKINNHPDNLEYFASAKEHFAKHPEISERMRINNPTKNGMSKEWRENLGAANRGKKRSLDSRKRYRDSKLGEKNPNYKHGERTNTGSRIKEINHRVTHVEKLEGKHDVYCLTVPKTGWFFANDVLVKNCSFCCINAPFGGPSYRVRAPLEVVDEVQFLYHKYGVTNFKIIDEMFVLKPTHYLPICEGLAKLPFANKLNFWAYARVDTVKEEHLPLLRKAGIRWLALGIESGSAHVRDGANKALSGMDIEKIVETIQKHDIKVIGNFIFGLPDDTMETMNDTLELAISLNCDFVNFYSAMAYPGSKLFEQVDQKDLPGSWAGYAQHSYECKPLPTEHLTAEEVLAFRDFAHCEYFENDSKLGKPLRRLILEQDLYKKRTK